MHAVQETQTQPFDSDKLQALIGRYHKAKDNRQNWISHWRECYEYALPQRSGFNNGLSSGTSRTNNLYDATAMDAVDQLAASLLGNLTPPWTQWFGFKAGPQLSDQEAKEIAPVLENITKTIQAHLDRSNFSVEMHQCFLDLSVGGTAALHFEESEPGALSAFRFSSIPLKDIVLEEGENGFLDGSYRTILMTLSQIESRFGLLNIPSDIISAGQRDPQKQFEILESILPEKNFYQYTALLLGSNQPVLLKHGKFNQSPSIAFRWMKSPGEIYGRSPVMKALPDIKTANKVVELILKNASIAVTGIWQADDDGVLNPANIELVPGAIIPKAVGSQGLKPLEMPARFDVSELVLKDLRGRIRHALLSDRLGPMSDKKMTATEVLERSAEMALLLGATYGRLQSELLTPLVQRAFEILKRRGEIPDLEPDGRYIMLDYRSPLAKAQSQAGLQNVMTWLESISSLGAGAQASLNAEKTARYIGEALGVPNDLMSPEISNLENVIGDLPIEDEEQLHVLS